jgi:hypothetical protein
MIYYGATTGSGNFNRSSTVAAFGGRSGGYITPRSDNWPDASQRYTSLEAFNGTLDNFRDSAWSRNISGRQIVYDITTQGAASSGSVAELLVLNRGTNGYLFVDNKSNYTNSLQSGLFLASGDSVQLDGPYSFIGASGFSSLDVTLRFNFNPNLV